MGRIKYLTAERVKEIREIIRTTYFIEGRPDSRVEKLRKLGYDVCKKTLRKGSVPVGYVHHYKKETRFQFGCKTGYYAWCIILNPMNYEEIRKINEEIFGFVI